MPLKEEYEEFKNVAKLMLKERLSRNIETLQSYRIKIITANNKIITYINNRYGSVNRADQTIYDNHLEKIREKLIKCLNNLQCTFELNSLTELVDIETISEPIPKSNDSHESDSESEVFVETDTELTQANKPSPQKDNTVKPQIPPNLSNTNVTMAETNTNHNFLRLAAGQINKNYTGDPLALDSFIDSLELLETLATTTELKTLLFSFSKTKLEGKAREIISPSIANIAALKAALRANIKPENSHVVEGRILSLKFNANQADEFSKKAEELADALKRTLIVEGVSPEKANAMTIEKTIELCRKNTQSPLIKSVLEASTFMTAKDVIAKLITQVDKTKSETQILSFHKSNPNRGRPNNFGRGRGRNSHNNYNGYQNNQNNNNNNNRNFNQNNRGRGRGNGRGQFNNNRGRGTFNYNNYNQGQNGHNVRAFSQSGNGQGTPAHGQMVPLQDNILSMHMSPM